MPTPTNPHNMKLARKVARLHQKMTLKEVAQKLGLTHSQVSYLRYAMPNSAGPAKREKIENHRKKLREQIEAMLQAKMKPIEIARELKLSPATVYYLRKDKTEKPKEQENVKNGASNGISQQIRIGIAFAETQRFIGLLSERLGVPAAVLGSRLAKLLGHPPVRE